MGNGEANLPDPGDPAWQGTTELVPGRECGTCTMCCKVMGIQEIAKPPGQWCTHCTPGKGCGIYETRPAACRTFYCGYRVRSYVPESWKPTSSRMVLLEEGGGARLAAIVDPGSPNAWKQQPYYGQLKAWARVAAMNQHQVLVRIGTKAIAILPDRDVDLGVVGPDEIIMTEARQTAVGTEYRAYRQKAPSPG